MVNYSIVNEQGQILGLYRSFIPAFMASKRFSTAGINHRMVDLNPVIYTEFNFSKKGEKRHAK